MSTSVTTNPAGFSTAPQTSDQVLYVFAIDFSLSSKSSKMIESIELHKYKTIAAKIGEPIHPGKSHREEFSRPIAIDPSDNFRASVKLRGKARFGRTISENVNIPLDLVSIDYVPNEKGERSLRFHWEEEIEIVVSAHKEFSAITTKIIQTDSRVLVIGNSGVGKSSLINKVFDIKDAQVSATIRGEADIEKPFTSKNQRFLVHDTLGFEAGDEKNVEIVEDFIKRRKKMPQSDRLHAVWLCLEIPYAGGRLFEAGTEKFLQGRKNILGDIPLVVVLTKVDLLDGQLLVDLPKGKTIEDSKAEHMNVRFIMPLQKAGGLDLKYVTVSTGDDYSECLYDLLEATSGNK